MYVRVHKVEVFIVLPQFTVCYSVCCQLFTVRCCVCRQQFTVCCSIYCQQLQCLLPTIYSLQYVCCGYFKVCSVFVANNLQCAGRFSPIIYCVCIVCCQQFTVCFSVCCQQFTVCCSVCCQQFTVCCSVCCQQFAVCCSVCCQQFTVWCSVCCKQFTVCSWSVGVQYARRAVLAFSDLGLLQQSRLRGKNWNKLEYSWL